MFELTNDQRKCFALVSINEKWECVEAKPSPYDDFKTYVFIQENTIVKCVLSGDNYYSEYEMDEQVSPDRKFLLPKTSKGKLVLLTSANILKRKGIGMCLTYKKKHIGIFNLNTECYYFSNEYLQHEICSISDFSDWVKKWCIETTDADMLDMLHFSQQKRKHVKFCEGDVFRFKIDRRLYGYGRILLDFDKMRKQKEPFWDILMCRPLICSVYHIVTERADVSIDEIKNLKSLPSTVMADNSIYYGEYEIIGNIPVFSDEDYPVMYGKSICMGDNAVCYQCGKVYRRIENGDELYAGFRNNGVSFVLNFTLPILKQCIKNGSNNQYWESYYHHWVESDLRNPKYAENLQKIKIQFGL